MADIEGAAMDPLFGVLFAVIFSAFVALCVACARRAPEVDAETQSLILRYSWAIKGLALVSIAFPILGIYVLMTEVNNDQELWLFSACTFGFTVMSSFALLDAFRTRVILLTDGIIASTPLRGVVSICWTEVREVRFSAGGKWFVVCGQNWQKIRVSVFLAGIASFEEMVRQRLSPEQFQKAQFGFDFVAGGGWGP